MKHWVQSTKERYCYAYAIAHYFQLYLNSDVSPYRIIINYFRFKGLTPSSRALSLEDVFPSLKRYGIAYKWKGQKRKYYPNKLLKLAPPPMSYPHLAIKNQSHWVVVIGRDENGKSPIVDSLSKKERRTIKTALLSEAHIIK